MATSFFSKKNNAFSTLLSAITAGSTSLQVQVADSSKYPTSNFEITVWYAANDVATSEIMTCTSRSSNTLTVTRAQEGTGAQAFDPANGTVNVWLNETAGQEQQQDTAINNLENYNSTLFTDTGAVNAYVITPSPVLTAYASGQTFLFLPANSNTGASTLNVNGLGAKTIQFRGSALTSNMLVTSIPARVVYDGTNFQLINPFLPNFDKVQVTRSANQTLTTGVSTVITFDTETYKTAAGMHSTSVNSGRLIALVAGYYRIEASVRWGTESATGITEVALRLNGTTVVNVTDYAGITSTNFNQLVSLTYPMSATDYFEILATQTSGGNKTVTSSFTQFGMALIP